MLSCYLGDRVDWAAATEEELLAADEESEARDLQRSWQIVASRVIGLIMQPSLLQRPLLDVLASYSHLPTVAELQATRIWAGPSTSSVVICELPADSDETGGTSAPKIRLAALPPPEPASGPVPVESLREVASPGTSTSAAGQPNSAAHQQFAGWQRSAFRIPKLLAHGQAPTEDDARPSTSQDPSPAKPDDGPVVPTGPEEAAPQQPAKRPAEEAARARRGPKRSRHEMVAVRPPPHRPARPRLHKPWLRCFNCERRGHHYAECREEVHGDFCMACGRRPFTIKTCPEHGEAWRARGQYHPYFGMNIRHDDYVSGNF